MLENHDKLLELLHRTGSESKSRIAWLVAISGFALLNSPSLASQGHDNWATPFAPAAWAMTALLGIVTHWQFRNRGIAEIQTYMARRELLIAYIINGPDTATKADLDSILLSEKEPLPRHFKAQLASTRFADRLELATMLFFTLSMALTIRGYMFS
jgi:hypothetical protein